MHKNSFYYWIAAVGVIICIFGGYKYFTQENTSIPKESTVVVDKSASSSTEAKTNSDTANIKTQTQDVSSVQKENPQVSDVKFEQKGELQISDIKPEQKGKRVIVSGYVVDVSKGKGHTFFYLKDANSSATIKAVLFRQENQKNTGREVLITESEHTNNLVNIEGIVDVYKGELEIIVKKVY